VRGKHTFRVHLKSGTAFQIVADELTTEHDIFGNLQKFYLTGAVKGFPEYLRLSEVVAITRD
jgi:hypothetical protein